MVTIYMMENALLDNTLAITIPSDTYVTLFVEFYGDISNQSNS